MYKHHQDSINNVIRKLKQDDSVLALIIAGSIAHGFAGVDSDVDIMLVVSQEEYERRCRDNEALYWEKESCTYEKGYVDGKYVSTDFIKDVILHGGEPSKFAFKDAYIAYSNVPGLEELMREASQYPVQYKKARMKRFFALMHEWSWYYNQGREKNNAYLINASISNLVLYGGRAILAYNETLYPFHKWFLRVLEGVGEKPDGLMQMIDAVLETKSPEAVERFVTAVTDFADWGMPASKWPSCNVPESELGCSEAWI